MYVRASNGNLDTYPYNVGQLRRDNPNVSFPKQIPEETLAEFNIYPVVFTEMPEIDNRTQTVQQESEPSLVDGTWTIGWVVTDKTEEEIQAYDDDVAASNRLIRNSLLAETDWSAMSDVTMTDAQRVYRQALRDITTHSNWPNLEEADWPTKP